jgi:hypothetical protein
MNQCPYCHRRLISHISPRCNWCGQEINDAEYQAKADADRELFFAQQALHEAQSLMRAETMLINANDPLSLPGQRRAMWATQPGFVPASGQVNAAAARVAAAQQAAYEARLPRPATAPNAPPPQNGPIEPRFGTAIGTAPAERFGNAASNAQGEYGTAAGWENQDQEDSASQAEQPGTNRFQNLEL